MRKMVVLRGWVKLRAYTGTSFPVLCRPLATKNGPKLKGSSHPGAASRNSNLFNCLQLILSYEDFSSTPDSLDRKLLLLRYVAATEGYGGASIRAAGRFAWCSKLIEVQRPIRQKRPQPER